MLSAKTWKPDAVIRFLFSVFICFFAGSLLTNAVRYISAPKIAVSFFPVTLGALAFLAAALFLLYQRWSLATFVLRMVMLLVCFYAGLLLGAWAQKISGPGPATFSVSQMLIATLSFQGAALVFTIRFLREHELSWPEAFGFRNQWRHAILLGIIAACLFLPIGWGLQRLSERVLTRVPNLSYQPKEQQAVQTLRVAVSWLDRIALGVVTILLVPVAEETLFRGVLYPWIKQGGFPRLSLWLTSLVFAAVHLAPAIFLPLFVLALILTLLYEHTDNLLAPITAHALFNALNFASLYFEK